MSDFQNKIQQLRCIYYKVIGVRSEVLRLDKELYERFSTYLTDETNTNYRSIVIKQMQVTFFVNTLKKELTTKNIDIYLLKSTALNNYLYPEGRPRGFSDIDILVGEDKIAEFERILSKKGLTKAKINNKKPFDGFYEATWTNKTNGLIIDLHTNIAHPVLFNLAHQTIVENSMAHPFYRCENIKILSPEINIIISALHMFKDNYMFHYCLIDTLLIKNRLKVSNENILRKSKAIKCLKLTAYHLEICEQVLNTSESSKRTHIFFYQKYKTKKQSIFYRMQQILSLILLTDNYRETIRYIATYIKTILRN